MGGRMVWASILGGLVIFVWGFLTHAVLDLGSIGFQFEPMAAEAQIVPLLKQSATKHAIYFIPGGDPERAQKDDAYGDEWTAKIEAGPYALVMVKPDGTEPMSPKLLVREFATDVGMALIAVFLIVAAGGLSGMTARIVFCVLLSLFGFLQHDVRFWNWYGFPPDFTVASLVDKAIAGVLLGIVVSLVLKKR